MTARQKLLAYIGGVGALAGALVLTLPEEGERFQGFNDRTYEVVENLDPSCLRVVEVTPGVVGATVEVWEATAFEDMELSDGYMVLGPASADGPCAEHL